jgi:hypothetical protein
MDLCVSKPSALYSAWKRKDPYPLALRMEKGVCHTAKMR